MVFDPAPLPPRPRTLEEIEAATGIYATKRAALGYVITRLEAARRALIRECLDEIKAKAAELAAAHDDLEVMIKASPRVFETRRTRIFHGVKVGLQKGRGKVEIPNEAHTVKRIKELYHDELGVLIQTTEKPIKTALAELPAADLKRLGVLITDTTDEVVIKAADSEVDKLLAALLDDDEVKDLKAAVA